MSIERAYLSDCTPQRSERAMSIIGGNLGYYSYQFSAVGNRSSLLQKSFYTPFAAGA